MGVNDVWRNKSGWRPVKTKLRDDFYVVSYIDYLNKFLCVFDIDSRGEEEKFSGDYIDGGTGKSGIYNGQGPKIDVGELYYFQNKREHVFPKEWNNRWILARLYKVYPSDRSIGIGEQWIPKPGDGYPETDDGVLITCNYWFYVVDVFDYEKDLLKATVLKGFHDIIDDNLYWDRMPKVNELNHWDNGIISNSKVQVTGYLADEDNDWDEFKLQHWTEVDPTSQILKMRKPGHENPDR